MNTGIQDACNLAWKLALVVRGEAGPALLATYDAERRPVGEEVVGRTVRHATRGFESEPEAPATLMLREAQLLVGYREGPLAARPHGPADAPQPGDRAPDCAGLTTPVAAYPLRLLDVLRGRPGHAVLLYATDLNDLTEAAASTATAAGTDAAGSDAAGTDAAGTDAAGSDAVVTIAVLARDIPPTAPDTLAVPAYRDTAGEFARLYRPDGPTGFVVRPDGQLGARFPLADAATALADCLALLTGCGTPPRTGPGPRPSPTGRPA